ncbi:MAG: DUF4159 domain-containing protein [Fibrobacterota bacterium]
MTIHKKTSIWLFIGFLCISGISRGYTQSCELTIARLHYEGGGDWYANPSSLPNLAHAVRAQTSLPVCDTIAEVRIMDEDLFRYPFLYMTGHGNFSMSNAERIRLRNFLINGGFLWADDNYGLDKSFRREMEKLFPENPLVELPSDHTIYSSVHRLKGLPKIHEHDGEPAQGFGIFFDKRLVVYYTYSTDIGDGMEDVHVHDNGKDLHELALKMGVNVVGWFFEPFE